MLTDNTALPTWYQQFQYNATAGIWLGVGPARGTSFPAAPVEGMQAILTDSLASPTWNWLFWYSTAAAKWLFLGAPWRLRRRWTRWRTCRLRSTRYADFPTVGPSFTVPRAGVYTVRFGATGGGTGLRRRDCGVLVGATTPSATTAPSVSAATTPRPGGHEQFTHRVVDGVDG